MKKIFQLMGGAFVAALTLAACSPDDYTSPDGHLPVVSDYADNFTINVDQETNYAYFTFTGAKDVSPVWILLSDSTWSGDFSFKKYFRKAGDYKVSCRVKNANGMSDGEITKTFHVDKTLMNGFGGFDVESEYNLFKTATITPAATYYATGGDWHDPGQPLTVKVNDKGEISVGVPVGTEQRWQCQVPFETTVSTTAQDDVTYDFSCIITSNNEFTAMVKFTHPGNDGDFYFAEEQKLTAGEPVCFYMTEMPSRSIDNLKLFFDFGTCPDNTEIVIENLVFIEHSHNDIEAPAKGEPEPVWVAIDSEENLWNKAGELSYAWWYAPGWNQIADPAVTQNGRAYSFTLPEGTSDRWMAQFSLATEIGIDDNSVEYDFLAIIESSSDFTGLVKLTEDGNDDNFFFADEVKLFAGSEVRFVARQKTIPSPCEKLKLFFDFGGNPAGTSITVKDIILQKHRD